MSNKERVIATLLAKGYTDAEALAYCNKAFGERNPVPHNYERIAEVLEERHMAKRAKMKTLFDACNAKLKVLRNQDV